MQLAAFYMVLFVSVALAQQKQPINLPGHLKGTSETLKDGALVAVATLKSLGHRDIGSAGIDIYNYVHLEIKENLNGNLPGEIVGTFSRFSSPETVAEALPIVGEKYIICVSREHHDYPGEAYTIIKFSAYSVEERNKIQKMIDQSQQPK